MGILKKQIKNLKSEIW